MDIVNMYYIVLSTPMFRSDTRRTHWTLLQSSITECAQTHVSYLLCGYFGCFFIYFNVWIRYPKYRNHFIQNVSLYFDVSALLFIAEDISDEFYFVADVFWYNFNSMSVTMVILCLYYWNWISPKLIIS